MTYTIQFENVSTYYGNEQALHKIKCTFNQGDLIAIAGPNGGGKSTFIKTLLHHIAPKSGKVIFHGLSKKEIAYLPQKITLDHQFPLTIEEVAAMGLYQEIGPFTAYNQENIQRIHAVLTHVDLLQHRHKLIGQLSGGQFQRMLFARLMLQNKPCIVLDEPFTGIDSKTKHQLMRFVQEWHQTGKTVIVVLHELELIQQYFPTTMVLAKELVAFGETDTVLKAAHLKDILRFVT